MKKLFENPIELSQYRNWLVWIFFIKGVGGEVWVKKYKLGSSYRTFSHGFRTFRRMQKLFELSRETSRENAPLRGPKWAKQESKFDINPVLVTLAP